MKIHVKYYMMYERFENGGKTMNTIECMKTRRSIRKFKPDPVNHATLESVIEAASYSPSWKNTQITRYTAIEDSSVLDKIVTDYTPDFNAKIIKQAPMLIAVTFKKGRCGFERDGSYSTKKEDRWQMFDVGAACQTFCLAAHDAGLGSVIMGIGMKTVSQICCRFRKTRNLPLSSRSDIRISIRTHLRENP